VSPLQGVRVKISNLAATVTQDDIMVGEHHRISWCLALRESDIAIPSFFVLPYLFLILVVPFEFIFPSSGAYLQSYCLGQLVVSAFRSLPAGSLLPSGR